MKPWITAALIALMTVLTYPRAIKAGDRFKDCDVCLEMVVVPAGSSMIGDPDPSSLPEERPVHEVTIS